MQTYSFPWAQHRLSPDATFLTRHFPARYFSRPTLVAPADVAATQENLNIVLDVLFDAPHRLTGGDLAAFGRALGYDEVRLAFACAAELGPLSRIGRADLHRTTDGFKLLELNLSSALGGLPMSLLAKVMTRDPELAALLAEHGYASVDTFAAVRDVLRAACPGDREITVALVGTPSTYAGHREALSATAQLLGGPGVTVVAADPVDLVIGADGVAWQGRAIDVVYRMFTLSQLVATETDRRWGMELIRVTRSGRTPMVSPLSTSFLGSKNVLALLWSRRMRQLMSPREQAAVSALVPISFQLKVDSVDLGSGPQSPVEAAVERQEHLVLKPAFGNRGEGVVAGQDVSEARWRRLLHECDPAGTMLQELVVPLGDRYATMDGGDETNWTLVHGMFFTGGRLAGGYVRGNPADGQLIVALGEARGPIFFPVPDAANPAISS